jgi:uncharacterized protein
MEGSDPCIARLAAMKPHFARMGLRRVRVFGSRARGDALPDSDLDLLVEFFETPSLFSLAAVQEEMEAAVGVPVDLVFAHKVFPELRGRVLAEARDV